MNNERLLIATAAMQGLLSGPDEGEWVHPVTGAYCVDQGEVIDAIAITSVKYADALLSALNTGE